MRARLPATLLSLLLVWIGLFSVASVVFGESGTAAAAKARIPGVSSTAAAFWIATAGSLGFAKRAFGPRPSTEAFRIGAQGEERVGRILDGLAKHGCRVLHDLALPDGGNIDHIVIAPGGVFTIETKNATGIVEVRRRFLYVGGRRRDEHIAQAQRQADTVRRLLQQDSEFSATPVTPILCFARARVRIGLFGHGRLRGIHVATPRRAVRVIRRASRHTTTPNIQQADQLLGAVLQPAHPRASGAGHGVPHGTLD